ncbi:efflux RND transporter periplasmic adaptor subunit [Noviluteimonas dokdonensis]|uniref:efflux RND transporter periplasmic adaptor subunit n=1 Tax=Noviluteimonas dokdonensis TaxID=414050 RepID=UPI0009FED67E|nr:efflux RND transporter periplasmic adaptor subunit [Lysobacter dokdonensis]
MHRSPSTDRLFFRSLALAACVGLALAACGTDEAPAEKPRPVLVVTPGQGPDAAPVAFAGVVRAREESPLSFRVGGQIVRRLVDAGDRVRSGDVLAELDPKDLRAQADAAQAQVVAAEGELARAASDKQRYARLANDQLVSRSTLDAQNAAYAAAAGNARAARAQLDVARNQSAYTQLRAPRDGVIATREAEAGQTVGAGQAIYSLAGDAGREVAIALPESRIREFTVGQPVLVELWSQPGERLPGRIREISAAADPQARTYATRIALDSEAAKDVELGQSARVYIATSKPNAPATALRLPLSALQRGDKGETSVWVVDANTNALKRVPVRIGAFGAESVPVLSGVRAGDRVVAAGGHLLREGQVVAPVDRENRPLSKAR